MSNPPSLNDLSESIRPKFDEFILKAEQAGFKLHLITVLRTESEQRQKVRDGLSWTLKSKHLPQPPDNKSHAIDILPDIILQKIKDNPTDPNSKLWYPHDSVWYQVGKIGESCGLTWGGRWKVQDMGHFEV